MAGLGSSHVVLETQEALPAVHPPALQNAQIGYDVLVRHTPAGVVEPPGPCPPGLVMLAPQKAALLFLLLRKQLRPAHVPTPGP